MILNSPYISGSLTVTGNIVASGSITLSGSVASASYAANASNAVNASTASFVALAQSASYAVVATTASFADTLTVAGTLTAQTLVVQTITSSVDFVTGSTRFGSISSNTHVFTGSMSVSGSGNFTDTVTINKPASISSLIIKGSSSTTGLWLYLNGLNATLSNQDNGSLAFQTNGTDRLTINSSGAATFASTVTATNGIFSENSGNVILQALKTGATNATTAVIRQTGAGGNGSQDIGLIVDIQGANDSDRIANFRYYDGSSYNSRLAILRGGNVGIGTATPSAQGLTIFQDGGDRRIMLELNRNNTPGLQSAIQFTVGNSILVGQIQHEYAASNQNHMSFTLRSPGGSNFVSMWLQNDGNVGIGTSTPYSKLQVNGAIAINNGTTYPSNARLVKQGSTSVTFTASLGTIGAWRPGHALIKVSGAQNGLQEYWAAWFFVRIVSYFGSGAAIAVVDSGGDTGSVSFSSSANTSSPQTMTFTLTDSGTTTNTIIADIDLTYNEGIISLS